jgi:hypothetical protein
MQRHQHSSVVIVTEEQAHLHATPSALISGNQRSSALISAHQRSSALISGSERITSMPSGNQW